MLFKISVNNIRKSLRDYAVYFFTLAIGVSIFYIFNAVGTQTAYLTVSQNTRQIITLLTSLLSGVSVCVSVVLGLLIVFASRFLMKRRNREFALYLLLGMGKGKISAILLMETLMIGIGSLFVGLFVGIGLSQLMSALVANLFEADMTTYTFTVSSEAVVKTVIYFGIMYVVVMLFNSVMISRCKLIDLMQSGRKSEKLHLKNPWICTFVFLLAAAALGYAYYQVAYLTTELDTKKMLAMIAIGSVSTFLIFWSVSGLLLRIVTSMKNVYFRSLNCFTYRQISSKINTMVMSMTVICLMLFVTICALSAAFSVRSSMNANLKELCPADIELYYYGYERDGETVVPADFSKTADIVGLCEQYGYDITDDFSEYVHFYMYNAEELTFADFCGEQLEDLLKQYPFLNYGKVEDIVSLSDYNRLMELYGKTPLQLNPGEYILLCDYRSMKEVRDILLADGAEIMVFGHSLKSKYTECQDGFVELSSQHLNTGIFVVPDEVLRGVGFMKDYFIGNYAAKTKEEKAAVEAKVIERLSDVTKNINSGTHRISINTKIDISEATIGLGAMAALLGLYIGLVFLISCGAVLALQELSASVDSIPRYTILRKIGTEEPDISKSLFRQTGIFFLLPLLLACIHSVFGMKFAMPILEVFGTEKLTESVLFTSVMLLLIYGGYFLITYFCSKSIVREQK